MGLRQRKSLTRCQTNEGEQPDRKSSSRSSSPRSSKKSPRTKTRSNPNIKLVSPDERLEQFLDPSCDFNLPFVPPADQPAEAPSRVEVAVQTLGQLESEVIAALFPPNGEPPATLEEISKELGMTVGEVQNIADEALRGLRGVRSGAQRISKAWN
jgi:hypothetical protein